MNHKWSNNKCVHCGIQRVMKSWSLCMCVVNHKPWEVWKYGRDWFYFFIGKKGTFKRPECSKQKKEDVLDAVEVNL